MSSLDDTTSTCVVCGVGGGDVKLSKCTSCAQKVDHHKIDGASDNSCNIITSADIDADIDAVSDSIEKIDISNDDGGGGGDGKEMKIKGCISQNNTFGSGDNVGGISVEEDLIPDDKLFQDPPPKEDCQICFQPMPFARANEVAAQTYGASPMYQPCCGKILCTGCMITSVGEMSEGTIKPWCPFCRIPMYRSRKEYSERLENRTALNDAEAFYELGKWYKDGSMGLPQDMNKAFQLLNRAAEFGSINAHNSLAHAYLSGRGVEKDMDKTKHHWQLAAIGGHERARVNLGILESNNGNKDTAMKHYMIAARYGYDKALKLVGEGYKSGYVTKDEYASALRAYQVSVDDMKSEQRTTVEGIIALEYSS